MTRFICKIPAAFLLGGCAIGRPAAWMDRPFDRQIVVGHRFRCAMPNDRAQVNP
ncbi:hypothetical protein ACC668_36065 [Rhizobium ruizarguesonis]